jgi:hypothetical protein
LPEDVSQIGASIGQVALPAQAAWQVWSAGQQVGMAAGQSVLTRHSAHRPVPTTQNGAEAPHALLPMQSTHPSVGLHVWPVRHEFVPLTPQRDPEPVPLDEPPQATATATRPRKPPNQLPLGACFKGPAPRSGRWCRAGYCNNWRLSGKSGRRQRIHHRAAARIRRPGEAEEARYPAGDRRQARRTDRSCPVCSRWE